MAESVDGTDVGFTCGAWTMKIRLSDLRESSELLGMNSLRILAPFALPAILILCASSLGVAEQQGQDRTGAPGSNITCVEGCHSTQGTTASASFELIDPGTGTAVMEYLPGTAYLLRMIVEGANASAYGMQATAVRENGSDAGTFSAPSSNAQLEEAQGRHIVEHNSASASGIFEVTWTAPASGSGEARFYMSGLACNGNGATGGDAYAPATLFLPEAGSNVGHLTAGGAAAPQRHSGQWTWTSPSAGRLVVADVSGRVVRAQEVQPDDMVRWHHDGTLVATFVPRRGEPSRWKLAAL